MMRDTCVQAELGKDDLSLVIDWPALRLRLADALVREGLPLPERAPSSGKEE